MVPQSAVLKFSWNSHMRKNSYSQWPDFSTTHFSNLSITPHRSHFLLLSRTLQFYPWFLELSSFSNQFSFPLKVWKSGLHCIFRMIIFSLDLRIVKNFLVRGIWVHLHVNTHAFRYYVINKLTSVFYASVLLLIMNFVTTLSK